MDNISFFKCFLRSSSGRNKLPNHITSPYLDGSSMIGLCKLGCSCGSRVPNVDQVIVAAAGQLCSVSSPGQSTDLVRVLQQLGHFVVGKADVVVPDASVAAARAQNVLVPRKDTNSCQMSSHRSDHRLALHVPDLSVAREGAHSQKSAVKGPRNRSDSVRSARQGHQVLSLSCLGIPDKDRLVEANRHHVQARPIQQVEVVVVQQSRRIQNSFGTGEDGSLHEQVGHGG